MILLTLFKKKWLEGKNCLVKFFLFASRDNDDDDDDDDACENPPHHIISLEGFFRACFSRVFTFLIVN